MNTLRITLCVTLSLLLITASAAPIYGEKPQAPLFSNLGSFHYSISTVSPQAQRFFDQGLTLFYGFEWSESIRSFKESARLDPKCAMCYWGVALSTGYKINAPATGRETIDAKTSMAKAIALLKNETLPHQALITALQLRFKHSAPSTQSHKRLSCHASKQQDKLTRDDIQAYIRSMKKVAERFPNDADAQVLYAVSLFWNIADGHPAGFRIKEDNPSVIELTAVLEKVLTQHPMHVGANHYLIHAVEAYSHPERALISADRLTTLVPGAEHLVHMPAHIYFLTGGYHKATLANQNAIKAFDIYNRTCHTQGFEPEINYLYFHNYDFLRTTASMEGRSQVAIRASKQMMEEPYPTWLRKEPDLQWFIPIHYFMLARFSEWEKLLQIPAPPKQYQYARSMWLYAEGLAHAQTGKLALAQREAQTLQQIIKSGAIKSSMGEQAQQISTIANEVLLSVIANKHRDGGQTIAHLKKAAAIQSNMGYHEPPDWYFPVNQALGDAYLRWNLAKKAKIFYEKDLKQYPNNVWSLYGLARTLKLLNEAEKSSETQYRFQQAWQYADIPVPVGLYH